MGLCLLTKPLYVTELADAKSRGLVMCIFSYGFSIGLCAILMVDSLLPKTTIDGWRLEVFAIACIKISNEACISINAKGC